MHRVPRSFSADARFARVDFKGPYPKQRVLFVSIHTVVKNKQGFFLEPAVFLALAVFCNLTL